MWKQMESRFAEHIFPSVRESFAVNSMEISFLVKMI